MRKFISMEEESTEPFVEDVSDEQLAVDVANTDNAVEEVVSGGDEIAEASDIQETVDTLADQTEASLVPAEGATEEEAEEVGLTEETAAAMEAMVDHFYKRLGIPNNKTVSLESFADKNMRKESTVLVLENLRTLSNSISKGKHIAQEGVMARFGNTMKLIFNTENKVRGKLTQYASELESKGSNDSLIKEPGWGRSFAGQYKSELSASDVIKYLTEYDKFINNSNIIKIIKEYQDICSSINTALNKSLFIANDEATKDINAMNEKSRELGELVKKTNLNDLANSKNDPSFKAASVADGKKISKLALDILNNKTLDHELDKLNQLCDGASRAYFNASQTRLAGVYAADMRATRALIDNLTANTNELFDVLYKVKRICYAAAMYLKASTK